MNFTKVHINALLISLGLISLAGGAMYILIHNDIPTDRFILISWVLKEIIAALISYGKRFVGITPGSKEDDE